jgi:xanthine dehydrogenase accessory factor
MMKNVIETVDEWIAKNDQVAVATVVKTWGSSPQGVGAKMAIRDTGTFVGSVSGGCVEGAVIEEALKVIKNKQPTLLHFGVADETAWDVGLACGGKIDVYLEPVDDNRSELYHAMKVHLDLHEAFIVARVIRGSNEKMSQFLFFDEASEPLGNMDADLLEHVFSQAEDLFKKGVSLTREVNLKDGSSLEIFFEYRGPGPKLIIIGGVHISITLAILAKLIGYKVFIVDPRSAFATEERFPDVDGLNHMWPDQALIDIGIDRSTAVAVLTHDPKLDDPALRVALSSQAFYIGALGSRTTQEKRYQRLLEMGVSEEKLHRLRGPIGLNLGSRKPDEIALAIMAEIVAVQSHSPLIVKGEGG